MDEAAGPAPGVELAVDEPLLADEDDPDVAELVIRGDDRMRFDREEFTVVPGQPVRLRVEHVGNLPVQVMGHNVVILAAGVDAFEFGAEVGVEGGGLHDDFVPQALRDQVIAFSEMLGGGESATVEFRAPDAPGEYLYICTFPGHFGQMRGTMHVE